jgi:long-chain acyl-CoA synthetase
MATVIFTSGTTGRPKALWYTHGQMVLAVRSITRSFADLPGQANTACWLPLANPFQRIINLCAVAANWRCFVVSDPTRIMDEVREIEPHFFAAVPRFYEKLFQAIEDGIRRKPLWQKAMVRWAVGQSLAEESVAGGGANRKMKWRQRFADKLVLEKIRRIMGRRLKYFISGSAPLSDGLIEKCVTYGWPIYEAYGVSENIAPMAMNSPTASRPGSVGRPLPENTIAIADDGEILVKGHCVAANLSPDGNGGFHGTGDLGRMDADGYLYVEGRKNDTFKLSTGRKIIPRAIEEALAPIAGVEYCVALGHNRKQVIALLNISEEKWRRLIAQHGGEENARSELKKAARRVCGHLPRYCRPADVLIVNDPFSVESGEVTSNLKLRRSAILSKYTVSIDHCYERIEARMN